MIPDYCYDCMSRQIPMGQMQGATPMIQGYPQQSMFQGQMPGQIQGGAQPQFQMPFGFQGVQGQPTTQMPMGGMGQPEMGFEQPGSIVTDIAYTQGWLRTQIGKRVKIEFLIGTNMLVDRDGTLLDVGISYVLLREAETDDLLMCDIYSIKFVRVYL